MHLNDGDILLWFHFGDVILELDDDFDQAHYGLIHFVIRAVQLSCGRRLRKQGMMCYDHENPHYYTQRITGNDLTA